MLEAVIWGLVQGLTEFLPISSSGHLVLVPAFLRELGFPIDQPQLAVSAVLHLGTLVAVLAYYRRDLATMVRFRTDPVARRLVSLVLIGTIPALVGLPLRDTLDRFEDQPRNVAVALLGTAVLLVVAARIVRGARQLEEGTWKDALAVGVFQAFALIPGISRSGSTITGGLLRSFEGVNAARYAFLLAIPTIAGGGLLSLLDVEGSGVGWGPLLVGLAVSAISGYLAITVLLRLLTPSGFYGFAVYCTLVGLIGIAVL